MSPATRTRLWLTLLVLPLSAWVGINGAVFGQQSMQTCWENNYQLEFLCWYVPEFSALWRPFVTQSLPDMFATIWQSEERLFALWQMAVWAYLSSVLFRLGAPVVPQPAAGGADDQFLDTVGVEVGERRR